jgi:hypothetical protein
MSAVSTTPSSARPGSPTISCTFGGHLHNQVDAGGDGGDDERHPDVVAGQQRQRSMQDSAAGLVFMIGRAQARSG